MKRLVRGLLLTSAGVGLACLALRDDAPAQDAKGPDKAAVERAREQVKMLDDLYKNAVVSITNTYVADQASNPAATVAKEVFQAMHKKGWHHSRLLDATGKPKNKANVAKTEFEKKAVAEIKAGKGYYEEIAKVDGKDVLRAATVVPVVLQQCAVCHGKKEGTVLGAITYEVPIK
ncbi:MAG TPA: DUF3365 domain-containing protein [Gemmataceae bacterium]|nr:DUF3365 domain-containing protein [Gemmataceae bacterium]